MSRRRNGCTAESLAELDRIPYEDPEPDYEQIPALLCTCHPLVNIDAMTDTPNEPLERLMTMNELAAHFQISRSTAFRMKKRQSWPCIRFGSEIRFSRENVLAIQKLNEEAPPPAKQARSTRIGTELSRRRAQAYNVRNGLVERPTPEIAKPDKRSED